MTLPRSAVRTAKRHDGEASAAVRLTNAVKARSMARARVVVACEQQSYREVVAAMLTALRPSLDVVIAEPTDLDRAITLHEPHLTICSRLDEPTRSRLPAWVLLYPDGASYALICIAGRQALVPGVDLSRLLAVVDEVDHLATPELPA